MDEVARVIKFVVVKPSSRVVAEGIRRRHRSFAATACQYCNLSSFTSGITASHYKLGHVTLWTLLLKKRGLCATDPTNYRN